MKKDTLSLPVTRKALFLDVIKNRFGLLFKTGLLLTLFFLPIIIVSLIFDQMVANIYANNTYVVDGLLNEASTIQDALADKVYVIQLKTVFLNHFIALRTQFLESKMLCLNNSKKVNQLTLSSILKNNHQLLMIEVMTISG